MPAASHTARTAEPAITPVPGAAGISLTLDGAEAALHGVRDRRALQGDGLHLPRAVLDGLLHGGRHFIGLAVAPAHLAAAVADHDQGGETEAAASLDHGGATPDLDHLVDQLAACEILYSADISAVLFAGRCCRLELQAGFPGGLRPGRPRGRGTCIRGGRTRPPARPLPRPAGPGPCPRPRRRSCCRRNAGPGGGPDRGCWPQPGSCPPRRR